MSIFKNVSVHPVILHANSTPEIRQIITSFTSITPPKSPELWGNFIIEFGSIDQIKILQDDKDHILERIRDKRGLRLCDRLVLGTKIEFDDQRLGALQRIAAAHRYAELEFDEKSLSYVGETIRNEIDCVLALVDSGINSWDFKTEHDLEKTPPNIANGLRQIAARVTSVEFGAPDGP